ncbi:MAG: CbtB-domain containing protein [Methylobacter sp.]|uniref:CbtB-domain containing protein n=1 Tax=Candidatus Methylobacter titanis TaxID=3053457 RepID=A0AA43TMJ5_9GAMM|nr:CbtB-domain containing protein [Candidatus Methylobacter titanis]MDI1294100.1 CbtB-domain containing protein [Candidatus Methylobacter titanis]
MSSTPVLLDNAQTQACPEHRRRTRSEVLKDKILPAMLAGMLGLALLYTAGFADIAPLHNTAHDGRHSASFPCH